MRERISHGVWLVKDFFRRRTRVFEICDVSQESNGGDVLRPRSR